MVLSRTERWAAAGLLLGVLVMGLPGIGRSFWLDEVWVANSVREPTWSGMFYYSGWLQTTPPLFLVLARASAGLFGLSNTSLRIVPLGLALAAVAGMLMLSWRVSAPAFAILATGLLAFHPTAVEYSRTFKQYSGESAGAAVLLWAAVRYLQEPTRRRFLWLLAAAGLTTLLAYPMAFLLPGVVLAIYGAGAHRRAAILAALSCGWFLGLYLILLRPNLAPELRAYWSLKKDAGLTAWHLVVLPLAALAMVRPFLSVFRGRAEWREWTEIICLLPCLLLAASTATNLYPASPRTHLFLLPGLLLAAVMNAEYLLDRIGWRKRIGPAGAAVAGLLVTVIGLHAMWTLFHSGPDQPLENLAGAVQFLHRQAGPRDLVLVHPSVREGFLFYAALDGWKSPPAVYGGTGWPCCARGHDARPGVSSVPAVLEDLKAKVPANFPGRIWLFYTARPVHWDYTGLDEANLWRKAIWESGCPGGPNFDFHNVDVTLMQCTAGR